MLVQTAWGEISIAWCNHGIGSGEMHIRHNNTLNGHESGLERIVTTLKGRTKSLTENFWVVSMHNAQATEKTALAFARAISNLAMREEEKAKRQAEKQLR